ncbi:unnamed protein product [Polarella glacialis]|uniref:Uncharacterized protein n=1 Tax=Polarella glacialis TaxID=89957 RepID=A0A813DRV7_POLGL|nr:unnamed protein product [Polarella glacialis]CAE8734038.1 unnamed protein product [Polarella glacialis]
MELENQLESRKRGRARTHEKTLSSEDITQLLLSTSAGLKVVKSACIRTFLLPTDSIYVAAGKAAGQKYDKEVKAAGSSRKLPKPFVYVFEALLTQVQLDPKAPGTVKAAVKKIIDKASDRTDFYQIVRVCRLSKCYGGKETRLELALVPQFNELGDYFGQTFALHAGQECHGPAPRGPIDRRLAEAIFGST